MDIILREKAHLYRPAKVYVDTNSTLSVPANACSNMDMHRSLLLPRQSENYITNYDSQFAHLEPRYRRGNRIGPELIQMLRRIISQLAEFATHPCNMSQSPII